MSHTYTKSLSFKRRYSLIVVLLTVVCVIFLGLNILQGPRLRRVEVDTTQAITQPNQRLTMYANQSLATIAQSQVKVEPKMNFTATTNGETVTVQFSQRLQYNTTYHITVDGVSNLYDKKQKTTFAYSFKTADPMLYYLKRNRGQDNGSKPADQIIATTASGAAMDTVYSAPMIQGFVKSGNQLLIATVSTDRTNNLYLVDITTKKTEEVALPAVGMVGDLHASPNQRLVGFSFTSNEKTGTPKYESVLYNIDLNLPTRFAAPVAGLDNKSLQVSDWQFAPDGTTILAQPYSGGLLLFDTNKKYDPVPLGQYAGFGNFSYNGAIISADVGTGPVLIDPTRHAKTPIQFQKIEGVDPYSLGIRLLANSEGYIAQLGIADYDRRISDTDFLLQRQNESRVIYKVDATSINIGNFSTSPNDQYLVVEQAPLKDYEVDNYGNNSKPYTIHTLLVDMNTGKTVRDIDGFGVVWNER